MLSIILPTQNEMRSGLLESILACLVQVDDAEIIVVDGGSDDGTLELLSKYELELITEPGTSRAAKLNAGIAAASGDMIFLHHPRSPKASSRSRIWAKTSPESGVGLLTSLIMTTHCCDSRPGIQIGYAVTALGFSTLITASFSIVNSRMKG
jgi:cellulose synthase/poly-beta-1,6-N-acetylglucosamine synthase-like glycosyltransferase